MTEHKQINESEWAAFYTNELLPVLQELDAKRKKGLNYAIIAGLIAAAVSIGFAIAYEEAIIILVGMIVALVAALVGYAIGSGGSLAKQYKDSINHTIAKWIEPSIIYGQNSLIHASDFDAARIFTSRHNRYKGSDCFKAQIGQTSITWSFLHVQHVTKVKSGKNTTTHTEEIFKGLFFLIDFNKHFNHTTLVLPDFAQAAFGWLGQKMQEWNFTRPGKLVKLENAEFEKLFVVYGEDQLEARYILTPVMMEQMVNLRRKAGSQIHFSFRKNILAVAIEKNSNPYATPSVFSSLIKEKHAKNIAVEIAANCNIVNNLDLNTRIWTKE